MDFEDGIAKIPKKFYFEIVDERYLADRHLAGDYADGYYSHNLHFLWASLMMEGRSVDALKAAKALVGTSVSSLRISP